MNFKIFLIFCNIQCHIVKVYIEYNFLRRQIYIQDVNCVETTVEWEQWTVADSDSESR